MSKIGQTILPTVIERWIVDWRATERLKMTLRDARVRRDLFGVRAS